MSVVRMTVETIQNHNNNNNIVTCRPMRYPKLCHLVFGSCTFYFLEDLEVDRRITLSCMLKEMAIESSAEFHNTVTQHRRFQEQGIS
jgi:hypothetical protein